VELGALMVDSVDFLWVPAVKDPVAIRPDAVALDWPGPLGEEVHEAIPAGLESRDACLPLQFKGVRVEVAVFVPSHVGEDVFRTWVNSNVSVVVMRIMCVWVVGVRDLTCGDPAREMNKRSAEKFEQRADVPIAPLTGTPGV
jgi:hypothetical protein